MAKKPRQPGYIRQAWLVIFLALVYGAGLAATQSALGPRIAENRLREAYREIPALVGLSSRGEVNRIELNVGKNARQVVYEVLAPDGTLAGWVLPAAGQGFQDRIELLVGVTPDVSTITGLYVLDQKETPNLGSLVTEPAFRDQFRDMPTGQPIVVVTSTPTTTNQIRSVTGATISSASVAELVNRAMETLKAPIQRYQATQK